MPSEKPSVSTLITDPDAFFAARSDDLSIKGPLVVVTLVAVVGSVATVIQNQHLVPLIEPVFRDTLNESAENMSSSDIDRSIDLFVQVYLVFSYGFALIGPYIVWVLYGAVFHAISVVFDGTGSFRGTMVVTGWGRLPAVFGSAVTVAVNYYQYEIRGVSLSTNVSGENAFTAAQQIQPPDAVLLLNAGLTIAFTFWAAYLWVHGLQYARDLSRRQAALTVAIPVLVSVLFSLQNLTGAL